MHALLMPLLFLMVHNPVDFTQNGACADYVNILNCVVTDYIEILEDHNNLRLVNKTGEMGAKIDKIGLQFESYDPYTLDNARTMMIGLIDSFLDALNQSKRLRPYLNGCHFTPGNIDIRVNFVQNSLYPYPAFNEVQYMSFEDGVISYSTIMRNCLGQYQMKRLRDEPLDFARRASPPPSQFVPPNCRPL